MARHLVGHRHGIQPPGLVILLGIVSVVLTACGGERGQPVLAPTHQSTTLPLPSPVMTLTGVERLSEPETMAGIQRTLDRYAQAVNTNDRDLLRHVVDRSNAALQRIVEARFDREQRSYKAGIITHHYQVLRVRQRADGFVQAQIRNHDQQLAEWRFRLVQGAWLLSEPTVEQLGPQRTVMGQHGAVVTVSWNEDLTLTVLDLLGKAEATVTAQLGYSATTTVTIQLESVGSMPLTASPHAAAYYAGHGTIVVVAPGSFAFPFYEGVGGWEAMLQVILTHEYTHMVVNDHLMPLSHMSPWMSEGIAEYVAQSPRLQEVPLALTHGQLIPLLDTQHPEAPNDLEHLQRLDHDMPLAYGQAQALVIYIIETYGGQAAFWRLAQHYQATRDLGQALQQTFGIGVQEFEAQWRVWLGTRYRI